MSAFERRARVVVRLLPDSVSLLFIDLSDLLHLPTLPRGCCYAWIIRFCRNSCVLTRRCSGCCGAPEPATWRALRPPPARARTAGDGDSSHLFRELRASWRRRAREQRETGTAATCSGSCTGWRRPADGGGRSVSVPNRRQGLASATGGVSQHPQPALNRTAAH